jgi:hypothetical protein
MEQTTLSKAVEMAEALAASVLLNDFLTNLSQNVDCEGDYQTAINHIATVILASYPPAEA